MFMSSDDGLIRIWTVGSNHADITLSGHQSDVKCIDWHPFRSLVASGSRESAIKLWDPKSQACVRFVGLIALSLSILIYYCL